MDPDVRQDDWRRKQAPAYHSIVMLNVIRDPRTPREIQLPPILFMDPDCHQDDGHEDGEASPLGLDSSHDNFATNRRVKAHLDSCAGIQMRHNG
jgi:hypothetical protein